MPRRETWTPYGLEAIRAAQLRRRRVIATVAVLALAGAWYAYSESVKTKGTSISVNGKEGTYEINAPKKEKEKPITIAVSPGRTARTAGGDASPSEQVQRTQGPAPVPDAFDWLGLLMFFGPYGLFGTILWLAFRRGESASDMVNYGVYKGAMPFEMITASHKHMVLSGRQARASLFGKTPEDHVPPEGRPRRAASSNPHVVREGGEPR